VGPWPGVGYSPRVIAPDPAEAADGARSGAVEIILGTFPAALVAGALMVLAHGWAAHAARIAGGMPADEAALRATALAERWPEALVEAVIAGVVAALVLGVTARPGAGLPRLLAGAAVTFVAVGAFVTGLPASPLVAAGEPAPGATAPALLASAGIALVTVGLVRIGFRGVLPFAAGVAAVVGAVLLGGRLAERVDPGMPVREVAVDLVVSPDLLRVVDERGEAPIAPGVLTPAIDQRTDTSDRPSIVMAPPAAVEFVVPPEALGARFHAAAGADASVHEAYGDGVRVRYRVLVDGELAWETDFEHGPPVVGPRVFDTTGLEWRHVESDGRRGIPVEVGQRVRLETAFAPGVDAAEFDPTRMRVGFGNASLVREGRLPRRVATPDRPNVVMIVMDTQRADRMGCYGYDRPTTPNVDALAERGLLFTDAYATSSWTWPSTASLMTGLSPDSHGVKGLDACTLSQGFTTLAEALQRRGYTTAAFSGNPIVEPTRAFDQGFETFEVERGTRFVKSDELVPEALDWLDAHAPVRFFLYLQLVDPHTPHAPHPDEAARLALGPPPPDWPEAGLNAVPMDGSASPAVRAYADRLYDASVATGDRWVGVLLRRLEELGLDDRTIVCFTSDHGEELFEHGAHGHGHDVWDVLVRAPLILAGPGVPRGERREGAVSNRFAATTIARMVGADLPSYGGAVDLVEDPPPGRAWFETAKGHFAGSAYQLVYGLRQGGLVVHWRHRDIAPVDVPDSDLRVFDARNDPAQERDLISVRGEEAREAVARILELRGEAQESLPPLVIGAGAAGESRLREIGYLDGGQGSSEDGEAPR